MLRTYFILILFQASIKGVFSQNDNVGVCSSSETLGNVCCARFYGDGTDCKKCPVGLTSSEGATMCTKCPNNSYGESCVYLCKCKIEYEICHHVKGCINKTAVVANNTQASTGTEKNGRHGSSSQSQWMMFLSITVAVVSLMIVFAIAVIKGYKVYVESKTSTIKAITKKNKGEHNTRKGNEYGTYKKTVIGGNDEDEYDFDSDNFSEEEDQYASIRESQLIRPQDVDQLIPGPGTVYNVSAQYTMSPYVYNHLDHFKLPGTPIPKRSAFSRPEKYGTTLATFQEEDG